MTPVTLDRYFELQWNPLGGTFDAIITNELGVDGRSKQFKGTVSYPRRIITFAVNADGTVPIRATAIGDGRLKCASPFADLRVPTPRSCDVWRANFYRFNRDSGSETEQLSCRRRSCPAFINPHGSLFAVRWRLTACASGPLSRSCSSLTTVVHAQQNEIRIRAARVLDGTGELLTNATISSFGSRIRRSIGHIQTRTSTLGRQPASCLTTSTHMSAGTSDRAAASEFKRRPPPGLCTQRKTRPHADGRRHDVQSPGQPGDVDLRDAKSLAGLTVATDISRRLRKFTPSSGPPARLRQIVRELKQQGAAVIKIIDATARGGVEQVMTTSSSTRLREARFAGLRTMCTRRPRIGESCREC